MAFRFKRSSLRSPFCTIRVWVRVRVRVRIRIRVIVRFVLRFPASLRIPQLGSGLGLGLGLPFLRFSSYIACRRSSSAYIAILVSQSVPYLTGRRTSMARTFNGDGRMETRLTFLRAASSRSIRFCSTGRAFDTPS